MKKYLLVSALLLCLISINANSQNETSNNDSNSGKITVLTHRSDWVDTKMLEYVKAFNLEYPDIEVEFEAPTDYAGVTRTRMSTKSYGDVLSMITQPPIPQDFARFYEPVGTTEEMFSKYNFLETSQQTYYHGNVYAIPLNANAGGLVYNKEVFRKAGITTFPKSSKEFYEVLQKIKDNTNAIPLFLNYPSRWTLTQWEGAKMSYSGDPEYTNKIIHEDRPFVKGNPHYEMYKVMYEVVKRGFVERDILTSDWEFSKQMMAEGKIGVMNLGSWAVQQIKNVAIDNGIDPEVIGYMPYPFSFNGQVYAEAALDYNLAINVNSKNKKAALTWAFWFADHSGYYRDNGSIPALKGGEFPLFLDSFEKLGVKFIQGRPAKPGEEGLYDKIDNESEIGFWTEQEKIRIVDAAMGTTKETYEEIMADWNDRWSKARETLEVE